MSRFRARSLLPCALVLVSVVAIAGCGGGKTDAEALADWAGQVEHDGADLRPTGVGDFRPDSSPLDAAQLAGVARFGREMGRDMKAAGRELNSEGHLAEEEEKNVTCFLATKAVDHELPETALGLLDAVSEYAGERVADAIPIYKYRAPAEDISAAVFEAEADGEISVDTALASVCDA